MVINNKRPPDTAIKDETDDTNKPIETKVYKRRWYILLVFSFSAMIQGGLWNTWGPIAESSEEAFGWTDGDIALFANWGPIAYLIATFPFAWLIDTKGNIKVWKKCLDLGLCQIETYAMARLG